MVIKKHASTRNWAKRDNKCRRCELVRCEQGSDKGRYGVDTGIDWGRYEVVSNWGRYG